MIGTWTLLSLILGGLSLIVGMVGATGVVISWLRRPKVVMSSIGAQFEDPPVRGGTILNTTRNNTKFGISALFGSIIVENQDGFFSESLRSCQADITVKRGDEHILDAIGSWDEHGKGSLEKEVDIKKGDKKQLHLFRAIIEPDEKEQYNKFEEKGASFFPILQIEDREIPMYESEKGKIWIQLPEMVEAAFGGWIAKESKPNQPGTYTIDIKLDAENLDNTVTRNIDFKRWLSENGDYWQQSWRENCGRTIQKAEDTIDTI